MWILVAIAVVTILNILGIVSVSWANVIIIGLQFVFIAVFVVSATSHRDPDLSHVNVAILSGSPQGNYHAIIAQAAVAVHADDDRATLAARVLQQEHRLLPRSVRHVLEGRVRCVERRAVLKDIARGELSVLA